MLGAGGEGCEASEDGLGDWWGDIKNVGLARKGPINPGEIGRFVVGQCRTQNYLEDSLENDCFCLFGEETFK